MQKPEFLREFYQRLLASDERIPPLFAGIDWERQHVLLRSGLVMMLLFASGNPAAGPALERIGRSHGPQGLGIGEHLYDRWVEALLATLKACDPNWGPKVEGAWRDAVERGIAVMRRVTAAG